MCVYHFIVFFKIEINMKNFSIILFIIFFYQLPCFSQNNKIRIKVIVAGENEVVESNINKVDQRNNESWAGETSRNNNYICEISCNDFDRFIAHPKNDVVYKW